MHLNTVFPNSIGAGSSRGPEFVTDVVETDARIESRNAVLEYPLQVFDIGTAVKTPAELETVEEYFYAAAGRAHTFAFEDPLDNVSGAYGSTPDDEDQLLYTAAGTVGAGLEIQLVKNYTKGGRTQQRKITLPKSGTLVVAKNSIPLTETTDYTVDYTTGIITLVGGLVLNDEITAGFEFYVRVRFGTDQLRITMQELLNGEFSIPLVEVIE